MLLPDDFINYLQDYILLKNELVDITTTQKNGHLLDVSVVRRTARTRRVVAKLTTGVQNGDTPPDTLIRAFHSPHTRKKLPDTEDMYDWMRYGWVIREYRFEKDERTVKAKRLRMGYALYQYKRKLEAKEKEDQNKRLVSWLAKWERTPLLTEMDDSVRTEAMHLFKGLMEQAVRAVKGLLDGETKTLPFPNENWRWQKRLDYIEFLLAFYQLAVTEKYFDWKQIGAIYYEEIGGSKTFDRYKTDFIQETERLLGRPLHLVGLGSLGTVTPIMFAGEMQGNDATYTYRDVHATTDSAVFTDKFTTDARVLWLVENRGVLTRMAYEQAFLKESGSFVLSLDGQLRSGHARLICHLAKSVEQVIIWTDVDEAGLVIAKDAYHTVAPVCETIKWIVPGLAAVTTMTQFEASYQSAINQKKSEQEQTLGGPEDWMRWINH